ncbi:MAG TPA: LacI family DNA-binding transcriptional regulator [Jiangellaceae bacterium]
MNAAGHGGATRPGGPVTLRDVAELAGVSSATASRALGNSSRRMDDELRQRVRDAAAQLRYVSNGPAQALASKTTSVVGLIVHDVNDPYYSALASGAMTVAREHDLLMMMASAYRDPALQAEYVSRLRAQRARAILLAGGLDTGDDSRLADEVAAFAAQGGRVVAVSSRGLDVDTIAPGNEEGARQVARHLHQLGHRRVGVIAGPPTLVSVQDRLRGFLDECTRLGVTVAPDHQVEGDFTRDSGRIAVRRLIERAGDLTAVFALNDAMAVGVLAGVRDDLGRQVPHDISVVGFDDTPSAVDVTPALTTVNLPLVDIGRQAMELALEDGVARPRVLDVPGRLVVRGSTAQLGVSAVPGSAAAASDAADAAG